LLTSQNTINGVIIDINTNVIEGATIIIKTVDKNNTIAFGISDKQGRFSIKTGSGKFLLKISYLGYKTITQSIEMKNESVSLQTIVLVENSTELDEVILKAENNGIIQRGDTTTYKIEKFLNGNEENLKDIIGNLPGLGINDKGKITANGKEIDRLLIDGENLYKRQHQLATDNISSEMVKNIELIRNYKDFESLHQKEKTGVTALNIKIKDDFKNKFTGNIEMYSGFKDKYKMNIPIFNFNKKIKFSLILNSNNLGDSPIKIEDYFSLVNSDTRNSNNKNSKVVFSNLNDLPRFLSSGINVNSKINNFITLSSIFNPTDKLKVDFYSIFNNSNQKEIFSKNILLNPSISSIEINEKNNIKEKNYFGVMRLKSIYKINSNNVFSFITNLSIDNTKQIKNIENYSNNDFNFIKEEHIPENLLFNSVISLKKNINSNTLSSNLFFLYNRNRNRNTINSNRVFLDLDFDNNNFLITQFLKKDSKEMGFGINYTIKKSKTIIDVFTNTSLVNDKLSSYVNNQSGFNNKLALNRFLSSAGTNFTFKINKKFSYTIGLNYNYISSKFNELYTTSNYLGVKSSIEAVFSSNNIGQLSYSFSNSVSTIDNLLEQYLIKDYRNIIINEDVKSNILFPFHQLNFSYFIFKPKAKFSFILNASFNFKEKSINNNIISSTNIISSKNTLTNKNQIFSSFLFFDKELKKKPFLFSGSISFNTSRKNYFQNYSKSTFKNKNISNILKIKSKFKESLIHFDLGYKYSKDIYNNNNTKSILLIRQPYLNLNGNVTKNIFWKLNSTYTDYISSDSKRNLFSLSPSLRFTKPKSNWEFNLIGNNVLNLSNQDIIKNNSSQSYFEQRITSILDGYVVLGAKIKF
jgi:hypothetical protein